MKTVAKNNRLIINKVGYGSHVAKYLDQEGKYRLYKDDKASPIYLWHKGKNELKYIIENYFISTLNPEWV